METVNSDSSKDFLIARLIVIIVWEFFSETSLHGFKYLVKQGLSVFEKIFWYIIQLCALASAGYIFVYALDGFVTKPTFTSLDNVNYPNRDIYFPAIAICPINKISKKRAMEYAIELSKRTKNHTVEWLFHNIRFLGTNFDYDTEFFDEYIVFQDLLDVIDLTNDTRIFDTQDKFEFKISPRCEDFLVRCRWGYLHTNCMDLFQYRKTRDGYCCLFNYVRQFNTLSTAEKRKPNKTAYIGPKLGLSLVLNTTTSDYYFSSGDHVGFLVNILKATEYPDIANGGMTQMIIDTNKQSYFKLVPTTVISKPSIEKYTPVQRGCLFDHELFDQYGGHYSFVDCLLKCKLRKMIELCECMSFVMPTNFPDNTKTPIKCTLAHNKCLVPWLVTLDSFKIPNIVGKSEHDVIKCMDCLPSCSLTRFRVFGANFPLHKESLRQSKSRLLRNLSTYDDISIVHLYYGTSESKLFTADVLMTWQEIVSHFGGLLGLCFGFSLINIVEIIYFVTYRIYHHISIANNTPNNNHEVQTHRRFESIEENKKYELYVTDFKTNGRRLFYHNRFDVH